MGVLDDAIREHLELKRRHGTSEEELRRQEDEALGPARREPVMRERPQPGALEEAGPPFAADRELVAEPPFDEEESLAGEPYREEGLAHDLERERGLEPEVGREPALEAVEPALPATDVEHEQADDERLGDEVPAGESLEQRLASPAAEPPEPAPEVEPPAGVEPPVAEEPSTRPFDIDELEGHAEEEPAADTEEDLAEPATAMADAAGDQTFTEEEELLDEEELAEEELAAELAGDDDAVEREFPPEQPPPAAEPAPAEDADEDVLEETPEFLQETPEDERLWFEQKPPRDFDLDR